MVDRARLIRVARGEEPADLVLAGATVVNVVTGELVPGDVVEFAGYRWFVERADSP